MKLPVGWLGAACSCSGFDYPGIIPDICAGDGAGGEDDGCAGAGLLCSIGGLPCCAGGCLHLLLLLNPGVVAGAGTPLLSSTYSSMTTLLFISSFK